LLLYYISDRTQFPGNEAERCRQLLTRLSEAMRYGVDYLQLREKDLSSRDLEGFARQLRTENRQLKTENRQLKTVLLINSRIDVAIAAGADGVHLRSHDVSAADARAVFSRAGIDRVVVAVSCHRLDEVRKAAHHDADFAVFGPVFAKGESEVAGLDKLYEASQSGIPVLALGGVTIRNAASCLAAGAAGVAGIRLFQAGSLSETIGKLRSLGG
jgi:thiamine-phosphate pyrophosphorylase